MGSFFLHLLIRAPGSYQSGSLQRGHYLVRDKSPREGVKIIGAIQAISNLGANDLKIETVTPKKRFPVMIEDFFCHLEEEQRRKEEEHLGFIIAPMKSLAAERKSQESIRLLGFVLVFFLRLWEFL